MGNDEKVLYQPRIDNENVRKLYLKAKEKGVSMTKLINGILERSLRDVDIGAER